MNDTWARLWKRAAKRTRKERDAHKRKSEQRRLALQAAYSALAGMDYQYSPTAPVGLAAQIREALKD